jgi:hypothetical protein
MYLKQVVRSIVFRMFNASTRFRKADFNITPAVAMSFIFFSIFILRRLLQVLDRLCGLVVRVLGYRSKGTGSIHGATRSSEN